MRLTIAATFKGENGSLGYRTGKPYALHLESHGIRGIAIVIPTYCPYSTIDRFLENWMVDDLDLAIILQEFHPSRPQILDPNDYKEKKMHGLKVDSLTAPGVPWRGRGRYIGIPGTMGMQHGSYYDVEVVYDSYEGAVQMKHPIIHPFNSPYQFHKSWELLSPGEEELYSEPKPGKIERATSQMSKDDFSKLIRGEKSRQYIPVSSAEISELVLEEDSVGTLSQAEAFALLLTNYGKLLDSQQELLKAYGELLQFTIGDN